VSDAPSIVWFRLDLRLSDNPALTAAVQRGRAVIPIFIWDDADAGDWATGGATRWWLHHTLEALTGELQTLGAELILRRGTAEQVLEELIAETGADALFWNRRYEPWAIARDGRIKDKLKQRGLTVESFNGALLTEPWQMKTGQGGPYKVFTPYWKAVRAAGEISTPLAKPETLGAVSKPPHSDSLNDWELLPTRPNWAASFSETWTPGSDGAARRLSEFLDDHVFAYKDQRNAPGRPGTSRLSPHLHFGEISPRQIWHATIAKSLAETGEPMSGGVMTFLSEVVWREFSYNLLYHFPQLPTDPLKTEFEAFPWIDDAAGLKAWQKGLTGYPIVDAGMRELWATGWMHNRVRMIAASFLIKDLMVHWSKGEAWFWDTLVDADLASNSASWQWVAGSGADAAPYFRVFNPVLQGEKFDPDGAYVRQWVPELAELPDKVLHKPWEASPMELRAVGVTLGQTYPERIVDHAFARDRALAAHKALKAS
jgi:deoxyribodipyrimidine photo-lyase